MGRQSHRPGLAWRDAAAAAAARALLEGAPGSVPAARSSHSPPPSCTEPALRGHGEVSRASLASSFRPSQLACEEAKSGPEFRRPWTCAPPHPPSPLVGRREGALSSSAELLTTVPATFRGERWKCRRRRLCREWLLEPGEGKARSRELQRPTPSTSPAISLTSSPDVTPSPAAVKRPKRPWLLFDAGGGNSIQIPASTIQSFGGSNGCLTTQAFGGANKSPSRFPSLSTHHQLQLIDLRLHVE